MQRIQYPESSRWPTILARPVMDFSKIEQQVQPILTAVQETGDKALHQYNHQFDHYTGDLAVTQQALAAAKDQVAVPLQKAIQQAYQNIKQFHTQQQQSPLVVETMKGVKCWRKQVPIQKVGLYVPGGTAPLFSTVLMLGVPALIAGCKEIVLCSPASQGTLHPAILYTAHLIGVQQVYKVGGAQAVAAMAYGTDTIPQVYKIFGPGNQYVTAAKQLVNKQGTAIDMPAGPSEVAVWADDTAEPAFVAADLLSQAEHGLDSQVILVTDSQTLIEATLEEVEKQLATLPRKEIAQGALENSKAILVKDKEEGLALINAYAPEHLIVALEEVHQWVARIENAGSVFIGNYTPESAGDYASGTNHTLPTNGFAKAYSGVSLDSFMKYITYQEVTKEGLEALGEVIETMAAAEELVAHKRAVSIRRENL
ncbi:MAG: histidinol dehydrogenase [Thermonemataceae bacterium]